MKKTKIIVPALGMLLLSTAASVTGTVAWFAVNTSVTVTGLQVKAKAEGGIVIAPYSITPTTIGDPTGSAPSRQNTLTDCVIAAPANSAFKNTATNNLGVASLYPTSTPDAENWYHATSNDVNDHTAASAYANISSSLTDDGKVVTGNGKEAETGLYAIGGQYFLYNQYLVKSTSSESNFGLYIRSITVTPPATQNTPEMNLALRIAVQVEDNTPLFFAPLYSTSDAAALEWYNGTLGTPAVETGDFIGGASYSSGNRLTADDNEVDKNGVDLKIWVYYEGEDENCTTYNVDKVSVDELGIQFSFATTAA